MKTKEQRIAELFLKLDRISGNIDGIISDVATTSETSAAFWTRKQRELKAQYNEARKVASSWLDENIPIEYREEIRKQFTAIKAKTIEVREKQFKSFTNTNAYKQSLSALISEAKSTYYTGFVSGENTLIRLMRSTQQLNLTEKNIEKNIAEGFLEKGSIKGSQKKLRDALLKKAIDGKYITIMDKNGKPEMWNLRKYARLVARTKLQEVSTQATINTAAALGMDLIQISAHNTLTPYDAQFEGKIFSLSGNDPDFPPVEDLPPFHPNCRHTTSLIAREVLEENGTLDKYVAFSNGETDKHPTRTSFIPVGERQAS